MYVQKKDVIYIIDLIVLQKSNKSDVYLFP